MRIFANKLRKSGVFAEVSGKEPALGTDEPFLPYASDFTEIIRRNFSLELKLK